MTALLLDPAEGHGQAEQLPRFQGDELAFECPLAFGVWQQLDQLELFLGLSWVEFEPKGAFATVGHVIKVTLHGLMNVPARRHLTAQKRASPRHRLVDVGVQGFGHQVLRSLANSLVEVALLPPIKRVRLEGSSPSSDPKVTIWRMVSLATV